MNRVIKFRYWDGDEIIKWDDFFFSDISAVTDYSGDFSYIEQDKLMQFTGLTDKNGKEIYEGDIIKYFNRVAQIKYSDMYACFIMYSEFDKQSFSLCDSINDSKRDLEVIGNVFENPELIK